MGVPWHTHLYRDLLVFRFSVPLFFKEKEERIPNLAVPEAL